MITIKREFEWSLGLSFRASRLKNMAELIRAITQKIKNSMWFYSPKIVTKYLIRVVCYQEPAASIQSHQETMIRTRQQMKHLAISLWWTKSHCYLQNSSSHCSIAPYLAILLSDLRQKAAPSPVVWRRTWLSSKLFCCSWYCLVIAMASI